ncbi:MAG: hypothetical protein ACLGHK_07295 [Alphaproteobacteria bacterium]
MTRRFASFACIDWSGAKGPVQPGIAVATVEAGTSPVLVPGPWSRRTILDWLLDHAERGSDMLIGVDFSAALPFADAGAYLPGWAESPSDARALWAAVDRLCRDDPHLEAGSFIDHPDIAPHFRRHGGRQGDLFGSGNGRFRVTERHCRDNRHAPATSCFNLVGAAQVGKSSLTGMRLLHRLDRRIAVWPFDPLPEQGPVIVEIYTTIAARAAGLKGGSKMRDAERLALALAGLGVEDAPTLDRHDDHSTDALVTALWLSQAAQREELWHPPALSPALAALEGWTFGIP